MSDVMLDKAKKKIRQLFPERRTEQSFSLYLKLIGTFFAAFLFSSSAVPQDFSPFGIGFCIAVAPELRFAALPGAVTGYWLALPFPASLRYCAASVIGVTVASTAVRYLPSFRKESIVSLSAPLSLGICNLVYHLISAAEPWQIFLSAAEISVGYVFTLLLSGVLSLPSPVPRSLTVSRDTLFTAAVLCIFLLSGSGFTLREFSPLRALCFATVLFFACFRGISAGSISGIFIGASLSLLPGFSRLFPVMTVGGFIAGTLSGYGQALCSAVFFLCTAIAGVFYSADKVFFIIMGEAFVGSLAFALTPPSILNEIQDYLRRSGLLKDRVSDTAASKGLKAAAHNIRQVCDIITRVSDSLEEQSAAEEDTDPLYKMKIYEMRRLLTDQFSCVGDFLNEFANEITSSRVHDPSRSAALKSALKESGTQVDSLRYFTDKNGAVTVEILLIDRPFDISWKKAQRVISIVTSRKFERPEITVNEASTMLTFRQRLPYRIQIGYSQKSALEGTVCGDSVSIAARAESRGFALISDGMGTGPRAAVDSRMTAGIVKKLLCSGFSFESALKIINSALIARGGEESLATVDGIETNLFTGETSFYKAGATVSLVRKGDRIASLEKSSLPLGILRNISVSKSSFTAAAGDIILLFSDGITQGGWDWIQDELLSWSTSSMEDLSMHILKLAHLRQEKTTADDMTVVAVKIENNAG